MDISGWAKNPTQWGRQVETGHQYLQITINVFTTNQNWDKFQHDGVQFALVCPTELDFLLDRLNPLQLLCKTALNSSAGASKKISPVEIEVFLLLTLAAPVIYMYRNSGVAKLIVKFMQIADIKF